MRCTKEPDHGPRSPETILLVDDDAIIRGLARALLVAKGYRVLEAADGPEALRFLRSGGREIDILVTDVNMPGMSGPELAESATALAPGLPVLYISGSPDHPSLEPIRSQNGFVLVSKPFTPTTLCTAVRDVLNCADRGRPAPRRAGS